MIALDLLVIAPEQLIGSGGAPQTIETPYGPVRASLARFGGRAGAWVAAHESPFAALYAAKAAGATRVVELAPAVALNRLLEPRDLALPDDLVDRTAYPRYTFFAGKGYGFLSQREPFCSALRGALLAALREQPQRSFARGVYLATQGPDAADAAWDADLAGPGVVPACFLARELELCYAPVCVVGAPHAGAAEAPAIGAALAGAIGAALDRLPGERACVCASAMQQYRDRGDIGADWRGWLGTA